MDGTFTKSGYTNWKKALEKGRGFDGHGKSKAHLFSVSAMKAYSTTKSIDMQLSEQREEQLSQRQQRVRKNRAVVSRLLSVTQLLAKCGAPFRGHDESESSDYRGLYREVVSWGAEKDPVLANHLSTGPANSHYLSPSSQNDQIQCIGEGVKKEVVRRVKKAKEFSILMDETTDLSNKEQVCILVRYVAVTDEGKSTEKVSVEERLLALEETKDTTGEHLAKLLLTKLEESGLEMKDIVGQAYDGGANMRGKNKGVQARVKARNPKALYTYCYAHNLNRSLVNAVSAVERKGEPTEARDCFAIVDLVYTFVEGSPARHALFMETQEKLCEGKQGSRPLKLKGLSDTRWNCRAASLRRLKDPVVLQSVVSVVEEIKETATDGVIRATAMGLLNSLRDPKFLITLVALSPVMDLVDHVCCSMQSPQLDLLSAQEQISSLAREVSRWQTAATWAKILEDAAKLGSVIDVDINEKDEQERRPRKIPALLQEYECDDLPVTTEGMDTSNGAEGADQPEASAKQMQRVFSVAEKLLTELERRFPSELGDFCILQVSAC